VLVWNADIWADLDAAALVGAHRGDREAPEATLVVRLVAAGEGNVGLDAEGRIVRLRKEGVAREASGAEFTGIHVLGERLRAGLPERGCLVEDVYLPTLRRGGLLRAFAFDAPFVDIGSLRGYVDANLAWLASSGAQSWVGHDARVDSRVGLAETVVGPGASVEGEGALVRCVVWPGAVAYAPLSDVVVLDDGAVIRA
jgi:NDP-sugar pyrophosphorylase family protein